MIQARQKEEEEDAARAAHNGEVVRQSAAGAAEKKRKRRAEKNKRQRKNKQVKKMHEEWKQESKEKAEEDWEAQSNAVVEEGAVLVAVQWRTRQAVRALRAARWKQQMQELSEWKAEQFAGVRVQLSRSWCVWRQRCSASDTSVSGDQTMFPEKQAAEEDAESDSWEEVLAAVYMAEKAANNRAKARAVKSRKSSVSINGSRGNSSGGGASSSGNNNRVGKAGYKESSRGTGTTDVDSNQLREHNPLFQS